MAVDHESAKRIPIVRLITRLNIGGPARQALLLSSELRDEFETSLVAGKAPRDEGELRSPDVPVHYVPLIRPIRPVTDLRAFIAVRNLLQRVRPSLLHTHMAKAGAVGRLAAATMRPRPVTVHTFHGHVLQGYYSVPTQSLFTQIERRLAKLTDVLVAVSDEVRDSLLEVGIGTADQYRVINLGFDLDRFSDPIGRSNGLRSQLAISPGAPLVGILGRLAPIKAHANLLEAMSRLPDVHLAVLGDGELRGSLEKQAHRLRIADRTHFFGWWSDVPGALADLDLVVLTSRNEGTPASLIEAQASGLAVVATDVGGVRTVVEDGVTGKLVKPGDIAALAGAIDTLVRDPDLRRRMGTAARSRMVENFGSARLVEEIRRLYHELVG